MDNIKQNYFIDNLKVLLIFLVVFGHLIERYIDSDATLRGIYMFIYTFHMPLFIFISGFLSKNINKSKKVFFKNLLVPYIILNIIWYVLAYVYTKDLMIPIVYPGWTLWYLLSLFFWRISLKHLVKIKYIVPISFILGLFVGVVPNGSILSFSRTIVFLPFFLMGYYCDINKLNKVGKINKIVGIFGISIFIVLALFLSENNLIDYKFWYGSLAYGDLNMNMGIGILYRFILYASSILLSVFICSVTPSVKVIYTKMAKSTMYVYSFHVYLVLIIFYIMPVWNINLIINWLILLSPIGITYVLSRSIFKKIYNVLFSPITNLIR